MKTLNYTGHKHICFCVVSCIFDTVECGQIHLISMTNKTNLYETNFTKHDMNKSIHAG